MSFIFVVDGVAMDRPALGEIFAADGAPEARGIEADSPQPVATA